MKYKIYIKISQFLPCPGVLSALKALPPHPAYIIGDVEVSGPTLRDGKWAVGVREWGPANYPIYAHGPAYVLSTSLAVALYNASPRVPYFRIEDIYATGYSVHSHLFSGSSVAKFCLGVASDQWGKFTYFNRLAADQTTQKCPLTH